MSLTEPTSQPDPPVPEDEVDPNLCAHCGTPMAEDQEWCLECGAARTLIHRPPDWRIPLAVIGTVVVVAVAALAVVLINLSNSADTSVPPRAAVAGGATGTGSTPTGATSNSGTATSTATTPTRTAKTSTATTGISTTSTTPTTGSTQTAAAPPPGVASWPLALSEWTVVLARYPDQATANATALRVKAQGLTVGVLNSSDHASLKPGGWLVFTGRYPGRAQAAAAAQQLRAQGHTARARRVAPTAGQ